MTSGALLIVFQSSDNAGSLLIAQESSIIRKIDYNPEGSYPYKYSSNTLKDLKDLVSLCNPEGVCCHTNIQAQPFIPPIPSIFEIAAARRPPKEPLTAAAENYRIIRYLWHRINMHE